ncbi:dihydroxyacetone kinase subunit L [Gracilibacillus salitolerans]|uniref:phosphoenolpyruvate--glycerone phosphotransferase n=1 Tax=Gracilibacillus salitolerans TaxID=2663022 RepID=A0A5Q2TN30_9BACI|nr:dihydroxyacetone kinase subunit DhaL [Gracilibacillus salitolerans]QGH36369.1 dihydroxyacetone kinase subunit L [Gracilibacillus salitolerans]
MTYTTDQYKQYLYDVIEMIENEKDYLSDLDRKLGDGDHGVTMSIGWQAVKKKLDKELKDETDGGEINKVVAKTFLNAVGSSVGPLYATGFLRGSKILKGKSELEDQDLFDFWIAFGEGIKERGQAEVGDKTMIDSIDPLVQSLRAQKNTQSFLQAMDKALKEAERGMLSTKDMVSNKGRSSRLGNRSKGFQDPGATSAYAIMKCFQKSLSGVK